MGLGLDAQVLDILSFGSDSLVINVLGDTLSTPDGDGPRLGAYISELGFHGVVSRE